MSMRLEGVELISPDYRELSYSMVVKVPGM